MAVLRAVVEEYIGTAEPVGSQRIAQTRGLGVSSATVRNDLAVLEQEGFLAQPHTSAGRIPTDKGYRYFVDHLGRASALSKPHRDAVATFFARAHRAMEELLHETSQLLAGITEHAALVVGPQPEAATIRSVQLVALQPTVVLVLAVHSNGVVDKAVVRLDAEIDEVRVGSASATLSSALAGATVGDLPDCPPTGDEATDGLVAKATDAISERASEAPHEPVFVGGTSNIAAEQKEFSASEYVARLFELLEQQFLVVTLVRGLIDQGVTVRIGSENEMAALAECAVVLAPVTVEGEVAGTVGVLGPTRMDYGQTIAAVESVSRRLGRHLRA